jgi:alpha-1,2-mannosyltransferase
MSEDRSRGWYAAHLLVWLGVLLVVQAPRLGGSAAELAQPVFARDRGFADLDLGYYPAAQAIRRDPSALYRRAPADVSEGVASGREPAFVNIPVVAWLFVPLTVLPLSQAGLLLLAINVVIALSCLLLVQRRLPSCSAGRRWAITLAFVTSGPLLYALSLGQTTPLVLLLLLLAEGALHGGRDGRAGLWLGLACVLKVPPLAFLPYLALRRKWRAVMAAVAVLVVVGAGSIAGYGWTAHANYAEAAIFDYWGHALAAHGNQSLDASLARLFSTAGLSSWRPLPVAPGVWWLRSLILAGLVAVSGLALWGNGTPISDRRFLLELGIVMCLSLLVLPITWVHYGMWLLPVAVVVGASLAREHPTRPTARWPAGCLIASVILINVPVPPPWIIERFDQATWFRVAISHQLVGTVLLLGLCLRCTRDTSMTNADSPSTHGSARASVRTPI